VTTARRIACAALLSVLWAAGDATAQRDDRIPRFRMDPYTRNEPRLMEKAGYVSYAPFEFGQKGNEPSTTTAIDEHFENERELRWVETAHFKIGLELEPWQVPLEPRIRNRIREELTELKERTGWKINPKTRVLDPWLRLHLFAQRLENHYTRFCTEYLRRELDEFPEGPGAWDGQGEYMGEGPYLGQKGKYHVLVFDRERDYEEYLLAFTGRRAAGGQRENFKIIGSLAYFTATENEDARLKDDTALYCNLTFNTTHLFINGYKLYAYDLPVWIREGLAHWFERRVDPDFNSFTRSEGAAPITRAVSDWEPRVRAKIGSDDFTPFIDAYQWRDFGQIEFDDHLAVWSRWDFLMSKGPESFAAFMKAIKGRVDTEGMTSGRDIVEATRNALQDAYGISPLTFDERWREWVIENYSTR
jgi:hypothetical protein